MSGRFADAAALAEEIGNDVTAEHAVETDVADARGCRRALGSDDRSPGRERSGRECRRRARRHPVRRDPPRVIAVAEEIDDHRIVAARRRGRRRPDRRRRPRSGAAAEESRSAASSRSGRLTSTSLLSLLLSRSTPHAVVVGVEIDAIVAATAVDSGQRRRLTARGAAAEVQVDALPGLQRARAAAK